MKRNIFESAAASIRAWAIAPLLAAVLAGCAASPDAAPATNPVPPVSLADYTLAPGDRVRVTVWGQPDLTTEAELDAEGRIVMPLLGAVQAAGSTAGDLRTAIAGTLDARYLVDPKVAVEVVRYRPVFVLGSVERPGRYGYLQALDVRRAVALAGGYRGDDPVRAVTILRDGAEGRREIAGRPDTTVLPGDVIEISRPAR
ncbi:MAG: polysaccharide biosynthesis/export family protein [Oceanibaculum nanhaiense]|uniref:polysaccharide biosynthesis/export family protein n=1 Tax=Oceanibaculum nanhaiense TaxID=1909734 RepID=UPI0025A46767|nr:polysaccharide biosynthesis/export family protein [Oceanibaculum nanhaiense]MDM7945641.1 polysaccharide biosynthesis/export family protein [Oceanibaculum nanhaiense]